MKTLGLVTLSLISYLATTILPPTIVDARQDRDFQAANAYIPNWMNMSLSSMSGATEAGNLSDRSWNVGDTPDRILTLGDLDDSLMPQKFQVGQILQITKQRSSNISLSAFPLVGKQTLKQLVDAVPHLGDYLPERVAPIAKLLNSKGLLYSWGTENYFTLSQIVRDPIIGNLKLKEINLTGFSLDSIPNLDAAVLENFEGWEDTFIREIPKLGRVPLGLMPNPLSPDGSFVARIDRVSGKSESHRNRTISGSNRVGFNYHCNNNCAHLELDDLENIGDSISQTLEGVQWISGKYQKVKGGSGCLKRSEPTGRHPFGRAFKVVVWNPKESSDSVDTMMFFRFKLFCGRSPYVIGPFPFFNYKINDLMFLGKVDLDGVALRSAPSSSAPPSEPAEARTTAPLKVFKQEKETSTEPPKLNLPKKTAFVLDEKKLERAIAEIDKDKFDPTFVGTYVCQDGLNCGRSLGKYQFNSNDPFVGEIVSKIPGGKEWLEDIAKGKLPSDRELKKFFNVETQDRILGAIVSDLIQQTLGVIDPQSNAPFAEERLIERIAQKYLSGKASRVDSLTSNFSGINPAKYGVEIRQIYQKNSRM